MERERGIAGVDESLAIRVSKFSPGAQRWLKTALQTIVTSELLEEGEPEPRNERVVPAREPAAEAPEREPAASLEDVITGKADLRDHLESYPELQDELEGLADVIDLLREAGETRRKRGEQILREEILGDETAEEGEAEGEDDPT